MQNCHIEEGEKVSASVFLIVNQLNPFGVVFRAYFVWFLFTLFIKFTVPSSLSLMLVKLLCTILQNTPKVKL